MGKDAEKMIEKGADKENVKMQNRTIKGNWIAERMRPIGFVCFIQHDLYWYEALEWLWPERKKTLFWWCPFGEHW